MARCHILLASSVLGLLSTFALAEAPPNPLHHADALLSIDQHRGTMIDRIVTEWGDQLATSSATLKPDQLRTMLNGLRADHLLAASLAGTLDGLRNVLAMAVALPLTPHHGVIPTKALGDIGDDVVYTPVPPCRLVDTRNSFAAVYQNGGAFSGGEIRNYTVQGGNGVCLTQLPPGLNPSAAQLQVFGIPINSGSSGDIEILPQGSSFGSTSTEVYVGNVLINTVSTTAKINLVNNQIGVQVRGGGANVAIDVVGYFRRPGNYGGTHIVSGLYATDGGGIGNTVTGQNATVAGGESNTANGLNATVAGGTSNKAGTGASVGGGQGNLATGTWSTVPGGIQNSASGTKSFAAGSYANANGDGCFVFADSSSGNATSCFNPNVFVVRALNGFYFYTSGSSDATYAGAQLVGGSHAWASLSDRHGKDNIEVVNPAEVLDKLITMPIATWNWKSQDAEIRHMGPMAQDFRAAFGLGEDDKHITTVDAEGVALAAIQGLHQVVQEKDARIAALERQVSELQSLRGKLAVLQAAVAEFASTKDKVADR